MPRRSNRKLVRKPRSRRYKQASYGNVVFAKGPLAPKVRGRLVYEEQFTLSGVLDIHKFAANGTYDPDLTIGGHQPRGFDQMMSLYDHNTVIGSKITITAINTSSTITGCLGLLVSDNNTTFTSTSDVLEYRNAKIGHLSVLGSGQERITLMHKCNPSKFVSISKPLSEDTLKNSSSANATEDVIYHLIAWNSQGATLGTIECTVRIEYDVIFTEPKQPLIS